MRRDSRLEHRALARKVLDRKAAAAAAAVVAAFASAVEFASGPVRRSWGRWQILAESDCCNTGNSFGLFLILDYFL